MNQKGEAEFIPNAFVKVLLILMIAFAFVWGVTGMTVGIFLMSFTQLFNNQVAARTVDIVMGLSAALVAVLLFIRVLKRD